MPKYCMLCFIWHPYLQTTSEIFTAREGSVLWAFPIYRNIWWYFWSYITFVPAWPALWAFWTLLQYFVKKVLPPSPYFPLFSPNWKEASPQYRYPCQDIKSSFVGEHFVAINSLIQSYISYLTTVQHPQDPFWNMFSWFILGILVRSCGFFSHSKSCCDMVLVNSTETEKGGGGISGGWLVSYWESSASAWSSHKAGVRGAPNL